MIARPNYLEDSFISMALDSRNIAQTLSDEKLEEISLSCIQGYEIDEESREEWKKTMKLAMRLAMQIWEQKNFLFENASNIQYPLLSTASIQFSARAYPNFVRGLEVVKGKVIGSDPEGTKASQASRVGEHMSYQCLEEMPEWEQDTDKLLVVLPILGCCFKKTFFSPNLGRNCSEFRSPEYIVINYHAKNMLTVPRITEIYTLYPNEIEERKRQGIFLDDDYGMPTSVKDENKEQSISSLDPDQPHVFLEQHTWYDLDDDGYKEPYVITVHKDTRKVARITSRFDMDGIHMDENGKILRIEPVHYYTKFSFMPSPDGSIYDFGYGRLLEPINRSINTTVNQLTDSGTLHNSQSGFLGKGLQLGRGRGGGILRFNLNEWKTVAFTGDDLRKNIFPLPTKEPSSVLFALLGFMTEAGDRLSSVANIMSGLEGGANERPTTTLARIEQGLKVFSAIHKRLFRSFKEEFKKLFRLNAIYLNPEQYYTVLDNPKAAFKSDYDATSCDIIPVGDPNDLSTTQKLLKAQMLFEMRGQGFNDQEINRRMLEAMQIDDVETVMNAPPPSPDPKTMLELQKMELERDKFELELFKAQFDILETQAKAIKALADAEAAEAGPQLQAYVAELKALSEQNKAAMQQRQQAKAQQKAEK